MSKGLQGWRNSLFPVLASGPGRSLPPFNPPHLHSTDNWAQGKPAYLWLLSLGRQAGCPGTCLHMAPPQLQAKPTPESGQEQQSRGLPTAHILPSLLRLLQQETWPLTPWQDPDSYPQITLPTQLGTGICPAVPTLGSSHIGCSSKGSLQTSI